MPEIPNPLASLLEAVREVQERAAKATEAFRKIQDAASVIPKFIEAANTLLTGYGHILRAGKLVQDAGWLPHHTMPIRQVLDRAPDAVGSVLENYYVANWDRVQHDILAQVTSYDIDTEAKDTFREALDAHGKGLYRCACRVLFPEVERIICVELDNGKWRLDTSQKEFIAAVSRLPAGVVLTDPWAFTLFGKLTTHIYKTATVKNQEEFKHVPNRHAALHGRLVYSTAQASMNTIIVADYIFGLVSAIKAYANLRKPKPTAKLMTIPASS